MHLKKNMGFNFRNGIDTLLGRSYLFKVSRIDGKWENVEIVDTHFKRAVPVA